jgi:hypothetical protein
MVRSEDVSNTNSQCLRSVSIVERTISIIRQLYQVCGTPSNPEFPARGGVPGISRSASGFLREWFSLSIPITVETASPDPKLISLVISTVSAGLSFGGEL